MKIDLHVHTKERSRCASISEEDQIQAAQLAGLDGLAITDHNKLVPAARLAKLNRDFAPFRIFTGIEVNADHEHWIVLGVRDPLLELPGWRYPDLRDFVRWKGGFIALAHPFRACDDIRADIYQYPPDGIEIESFNTQTRWESDIRKLAERFGLTLLRNTDAHAAGQVGAYYNDLPVAVETDRDLVKVLREMKVSRLIPSAVLPPG